MQLYALQRVVRPCLRLYAFYLYSKDTEVQATQIRINYSQRYGMIFQKIPRKYMSIDVLK